MTVPAASLHPGTANAALTALFVAGALFQLYVLPLALLPRNIAWGWLLAPLALLSNTHWSLVHEAIHGHLFRDRGANRRAGRLLAVLHGAPFALLRGGHLLHHAYNRTARERTEVYDAGPGPLARTGYYARLLGGLYAGSALGALLFLLPRRLIERAGRRLDSERSVVGLLAARLAAPRALREVRADALLCAVLFGVAFWCYGDHAWMLAAALAARALLISLTDNVYHYATPLDAVRYAADLRLPAPLQALLLNFNLHGMHHRHPELDWRALGRRFERECPAYAGGFFAALAAQLRGPLAPEQVPLSPPRR